MRKPVVFSAVSLCLLAGCATQGGGLSERMVLLGEVSHTVTERDVEENRLAPEMRVAGLADRLRRLGFTKEQVAAGRVVALRERIYWHTVVSGIRHDDFFLALVPEGMRVERGNIVEKVLGRPPTILRVRARDQVAGDCRFDEVPPREDGGVMGMLSRLGPSGEATLYCKGIEREGWTRPGSYWHKPAPENARADGKSM